MTPILNNQQRAFFETAQGKFLREAALIIGVAVVVATFRTSGIVWGGLLLASLMVLGAASIRHAGRIHRRNTDKNSGEIAVVNPKDVETGG